jgi:Uma2 family endonuclease
MATKVPNPTPNEPNRPASSRAKAKAKPKTATKADAAGSKSKSKSNPTSKAKPKTTAAKPAPAVKADSKVKATRSAAPKKAGAKPAAIKPKTGRKTSSKARKAAAAVAPPEASAFENHVVKTLFDSLEAHVAANELGHVVGPKEFELGRSEPTGRLPDIPFVSNDRWAPYRRVPAHDRWHVAPDLLVQVVRKGEPAEDFTTQLDECFNAGVRRVWLVFPDKGEVRVYESSVDVKDLGEKHSIDGGDVLPGFEHSLALLFREPKDLG